MHRNVSEALVLVAAIVSGACSGAAAGPAGGSPGAAAPRSGPAAVGPAAPAPRAVATPPAAPGGPKNVEALLGDHFFDPQVIVIREGTSVTWRNSSGTHDVTARDGSFRSPTLGDSFSHTFTRPGRYAFFCSYHPGEMRGEVVVEPAD